MRDGIALHTARAYRPHAQESRLATPSRASTGWTADRDAHRAVARCCATWPPAAAAAADTLERKDATHVDGIAH